MTVPKYQVLLYNSTFEYLRDENLHIIWMDGGDGMRGALLAVVIILHPHHPRIHMLFMFYLLITAVLFEKGSAGRSGSLLQICVAGRKYVNHKLIRI